MMKAFHRFLAALLLVAFLAAPSWAATYYISPTGNDSTGAGTFASPWATLAKIQSVAVANDVCYVIGPGTYAMSSPVTFTVRVYLYGRSTSDTIVAYTDRPVFQATAAMTTLVRVTNPTITGVIFDGNNLTTTSDLTGASGSTCVLCDAINSSAIGMKVSSVQFCRAYANGTTGIDLSLGGGSAVGSISHDNTGDGIYASSAQACLSYRNGGYGFTEFGITTGGLWTNNVAALNGASGFRLSASPTLVANIAINNTAKGWLSYSGITPVVQTGNVSFGNGTADDAGFGTFLTADPKLVSPTGTTPDLRMRTDSPYFPYSLGPFSALIGSSLAPDVIGGGGSTPRRPAVRTSGF